MSIDPNKAPQVAPARNRPAFSVRHEKRRPFRISHLEAEISGLPSEFHGFRIVQLTDLHFGPITTESHIARAIDLTNELEPDIVALTGDYVQYSATGLRHTIATRFNPRMMRWIDYRREVRELAERLGKHIDRLQPKLSIYGVFGNHDHLEGIGSIIRQFPKKVGWLKNESKRVERQGATVMIAGIDDIGRGKPNLQRAVDFAFLDGSLLEEAGRNEDKRRLADGPPPVFTVLLSHNPDVTIEANHPLLHHVDLVLCGHTHGGQIRIPGFRPPVTRTEQKLHTNGLSFHHETAIYVSSGIGYGGIPVRLFCPPEITVITLKPK